MSFEKFYSAQNVETKIHVDIPLLSLPMFHLEFGKMEKNKRHN